MPDCKFLTSGRRRRIENWINDKNSKVIHIKVRQQLRNMCKMLKVKCIRKKSNQRIARQEILFSLNVKIRNFITPESILV